MTGPQNPGQHPQNPGQNPWQPPQPPGQPGAQPQQPWAPTQQPEPLPPTANPFPGQQQQPDGFAPVPGQFPQGQPQFGAQPFDGQPGQFPPAQFPQGQYGAPQYGAPQYGGQPMYQGQAPAPANSNKALWIIGGLVLAVAAVGGILWATLGGGIGQSADEKQVRALYEGMANDAKSGNLSGVMDRMCSIPGMSDLGLDDLGSELGIDLSELGIDMTDLNSMAESLGIDLGDIGAEMASEFPSEITVDSVEINGDQANVQMTAVVDGQTETETSKARKVDGTWCIAD